MECLKNKQQRVECESGCVFLQKVEKDVPYRHPKRVGSKPKSVPFDTLKVPFSTPKVPNGTFGCQSHFRAWVHFGLIFLGFLEPSHALRRVFNPYSNIFISFMDNSGIFSNNYLVDKYSKINLDKVQIIHNFIVIQLSPLI